MKRFDWALENSVPISVATPASKLLLCYAVILSAAERSEESRSGLFRRPTAGRSRCSGTAGRDAALRETERALSRTS